jgi:hypothetical protein
MSDGRFSPAGMTIDETGYYVPLGFDSCDDLHARAIVSTELPELGKSRLTPLFKPV